MQEGFLFGLQLDNTHVTVCTRVAALIVCKAAPGCVESHDDYFDIAEQRVAKQITKAAAFC